MTPKKEEKTESDAAEAKLHVVISEEKVREIEIEIDERDDGDETYATAPNAPPRHKARA
jgi:hypothetical protein